MIDKLDLLSVQYDVELEKKEKYKIAKEVFEFADNNVCDELFYDTCMEQICNEIGFESGIIPDEAYDIWNIIEDEFL